MTQITKPTYFYFKEVLPLLVIFFSNTFTAILFLDQWKVICIAVIPEKHLNMQIKPGIVWKGGSCLFYIQSITSKH